MARKNSQLIARRHVLGGLVAVGAVLNLPLGAGIAMGAHKGTPRQSLGPFYPTNWSGDVDGDLVRVQGEAARALGTVLHLSGQLRDAFGAPISGATIEIWQCDAQGVYRHPLDERGTRQHDGGFQGRGRAFSDQSGQYQFRTIRPVAYPGRTPHIHFRITTPDRKSLITQMYIHGEKLNTRDGLLNSIRNPHQRESLIVRLDATDRIEQGALSGRFDIVIA